MSKKLLLVVAIVSFGCVGPGIKVGKWTLTPMATVETIGVALTETDSGNLVGSIGPTFDALLENLKARAESLMGGK